MTNQELDEIFTEALVALVAQVAESGEINGLVVRASTIYLLEVVKRKHLSPEDATRTALRATDKRMTAESVARMLALDPLNPPSAEDHAE